MKQQCNSINESTCSSEKGKITLAFAALGRQNSETDVYLEELLILSD